MPLSRTFFVLAKSFFRGIPRQGVKAFVLYHRESQVVKRFFRNILPLFRPFRRFLYLVDLLQKKPPNIGYGGEGRGKERPARSGDRALRAGRAGEGPRRAGRPRPAAALVLRPGLGAPETGARIAAAGFQPASQ